MGRNSSVLVLVIVSTLVIGFGAASAARPLLEEDNLWGWKKNSHLLLVASLQKGSVPTPSECTNVPGNAGGHCPAVREMHFAGRRAQAAVTPPPVHHTVAVTKL
ncbi:hypothetical protein H6P81_015510 [Aristolochia fimbriata]|uniref:Uncharacterized protein n=1 Tax=Aristolochia fimbriata TaxID=158543 RepID=A0AAV7E5P9_ARIFI|nr:hypothetical protein H6P81_015510 [Aristolochia fimbriata]